MNAADKKRAARLRKEARQHEKFAANSFREAAAWLREAATNVSDFDSASSRAQGAHQFVADAYVHLGAARWLVIAATDLEEG